MSGATDVDVLVVGGGLAGTAALRELARRGARVVLVERGDLAAGGSVGALGTIEQEDLLLEGRADAAFDAERVAREREAAIFVATAPHLATRVPVLTLPSGTRRGVALLARWDALLSLRTRQGRAIDREPLDARALRAREPAVTIEDDRGALLSTRVRLDAQRLALAFARDAAEQGAELRLREEVVALEVHGAGVRARVRRGGLAETTEISARAAVIATGAWPAPGSGARPAAERRVHLVVEHSVTTHAIVIDGVSVVPFHNASVISSAPRAHDGEPGSTRVSRDEVRALLASVARHLPSLRDARVNAAYASIRRKRGPSVELPPPLFAMPAGSPWDVRARAEALGARVARALGIETPSSTASAKLPGGEEVVDSFVVAERLGIPEASARRIVLRHGARCLDIGARIGRRRTEASVVCACEPVLEAEIRHAVRAEHAEDVGDVGRRTLLGHGACAGMRCAHRAAQVICAERALPPSEAHAMTRRFLVERWHARLPALDPTTLAQEELAHARWVSASEALAPEGEAPEGEAPA